MKKREIVRSKIGQRVKNKFEKASKKLRVHITQVTLAIVFVAFMLPLNNQVLADEKIKPGKKQATLILSNGRKILLKASSDTIVNSETKGVHIKIDSCGINYITPDDKKDLDQPKGKLLKKKKVNSK